MNTYTFFKVELAKNIAHVAFNRPEKANALHAEAWVEMKQLFGELSKTPEVRVIVLSGEGKHWCGGIDLKMLMRLAEFNTIDCEGRKREEVRDFIYHLQDCITAIEQCRKPVLAAIHNGCIGGGVDICTACDIRYCTEEAYFTIKEVDLGLVADIGTLQRLPKIINSGLAYEMAYTGRKVYGPEAKEIGLVARCYPDKEQMLEGVMEIAQQIASKAPIVIRGTKEIIRYSRDHSVEESLRHMGTFNAAFLLSNDLAKAFEASMSREVPEFED
ncbi:MAG: crotonase/enoyl-CoA hydratase family protein [Bacteroidota bacterium]